MKNRYIVLWVFLLLVSSPLSAQNDTLKVLFVGNSYTYFWNLPQVVEEMAKTQDFPMIARQSTEGGTSLEQHWKGEKDLETISIIKSQQWDIIVFQNHSMSSINNPESFMEYGKKFIELAREQGAEPYLYMTWAREANPMMFDTIQKAYKKLAEETGTKLVPVGEAWQMARQNNPDIDLFDPDGTHPSPTGTYLTACMFFNQLTGLPVDDIPKRIKTSDRNGQKLYLMIQPQLQADYLQAIVMEIAKSGKGEYESSK
ncbi:DUF4886 domain-containing protein [Mangrovivirga sp. M17]|uniref:DUF4886 domain-containing protein n=1 Tax=Mangrovivirga halotolerans TaxID=2993936 RepID=A0ABT3RR20_9BACT|nr:DUF4886 domain-containing protein [Mangrovivirga halotolerans]MCX2743635.1 DUF4886 domain-containing protein [Mangrovivirga halotolerans]